MKLNYARYISRVTNLINYKVFTPSLYKTYKEASSAAYLIEYPPIIQIYYEYIPQSLFINQLIACQVTYLPGSNTSDVKRISITCSGNIDKL